MPRRLSLEREDTIINPFNTGPRPLFAVWLADPTGKAQVFHDIAGIVDWAATAYDDDALEALLDALNEAADVNALDGVILAKLRHTPPPFHIFERQAAGDKFYTVVTFATTREYLVEP